MYTINIDVNYDCNFKYRQCLRDVFQMKTDEIDISLNNIPDLDDESRDEMLFDENQICKGLDYIYDLTKNICKQIKISNLDIQLIYISTDHVFDGSSKLYKEKNLINKKPKTNLGKLKLASENYVSKVLKKFTIIRLSAVMDDPRLSSFVKKSLKQNKKLDLFSNVFFSPVLSYDLNRLINVIKNKRITDGVFHCSGERRVSKYLFYTELFNNKKKFKKKKLYDFKFNLHDLSLSNKNTCKKLKIKMTNYKKSLNIARENIKIK